MTTTTRTTRLLQPGQATATASSVAHLLFLDIDGVLNTSVMPGGCRVHPILMRRLARIILESNGNDNSKLSSSSSSIGIVLSSSWRLEEQYYSHFVQQLDQALAAAAEQQNDDDDKDTTAATASSSVSLPWTAPELMVGSTPQMPIRDFLNTNKARAIALHRAYEIASWLRHLRKATTTGNDDDDAKRDDPPPCLGQQWVILDDLDVLSHVVTEHGNHQNDDDDDNTDDRNPSIHYAELRAVVEGHFVKTDPEAGLTERNAEQVLELFWRGNNNHHQPHQQPLEQEDE
eukprot:CAMPEP_0168750106 /NCGR_PEP_ID=MMETSP0724-20121128/17082_1 /TAXON_ID=265536 /ORGANISM="Amphiprora sp., Strain CCMP467" /LENGTH=287 /DNA_ID=CAMNT_0008798079 /DNA_START=1 /DNA_END=864 /DNA_ORIENTATION=-